MTAGELAQHTALQRAVVDKVQALQTKSCGYEARGSIILGSKSYHNTPSDDAGNDSEGGLLWGARFSGSTEHKKITRGTRQCHHINTYIRQTKCTEYYLALKLHLPIASSDMFKYAFGNLSTFENDTKAYEKFIDSFGLQVT